MPQMRAVLRSDPWILCTATVPQRTDCLVDLQATRVQVLPSMAMPPHVAATHASGLAWPRQ